MTLTAGNSTELKNLENSHLAIQFGLEGFSYCVFDKDLSEVVFLKHFEFDPPLQHPEQLLNKIKELSKTETFLSNHFDSVNVTHRNHLSAIVPSALYNKKNRGDYLKYAIEIFENDWIETDEITEIDAKNVYIPYVNVNNFLIDKYIGFDYMHSSSILISSLLKHYKQSLQKLFFVNVNSNSLEIIYLKDSQLLLHNHFLYATKEDFLYYILFTMEQLFLNPDEQELIFMGHIDKTSPLYEITYIYVRYIRFLDIDNPNVSETFYKTNESIKKHHFFELLNQF